VSLRDETFGALAYHHGTRRLVFLKSPELVTLVRSLEHFESADLAMNAVIELEQRGRYLVALSSLAASEILCER
jgi:mycofactocin biosynthesis protein MftB